jgi:hypothetical protein
MRGYVFRFAPESGHRALQSACPFGWQYRTLMPPTVCREIDIDNAKDVTQAVPSARCISQPLLSTLYG